ncbi:DNA-deoxyinosine glycosylase [Sphingomonas immobilis]|uniref:DNA-deoxyinosine glycosylase n=1 Tax=Sphingomonas immobilis TaxID=3063997 RepID=A0ABT8ZY23_9SPHN|nr:DNA-deoxyinosine glycosylase [Sphingomonas sp. CA1-15]MDO7842029.1 DNA-deoxyinosine glycosylase [Sphingomonas sp. CA1-15]
MTLKQSFPPVVDAYVRVLILGSLPGEKSLAAQRYYANPQNQFWRLLSGALAEDFVALEYQARLARLLSRHAGLWDVVATARREGSTDAALRDVSANDLTALAASLPDLRAIAFNGGAAHRHGLKQLGAAAERYAILALPSSSAMHTTGLAAKLPAWQAIATYLT